MAMELLEGETLSKRLARGSFKTNELLEAAIQISDGLTAAHAKGIIQDKASYQRPYDRMQPMLSNKSIKTRLSDL